MDINWNINIIFLLNNFDLKTEFGQYVMSCNKLKRLLKPKHKTELIVT